MVFQILVLKTFKNIVLEIQQLVTCLVCTNIDFGLAYLTICEIVTLLKRSRQQFTWNYREEGYI